MAFDPVQYKTTTRQQWEDEVDAWHRRGPTLVRDGGRIAAVETGDGFGGPRETLVASGAK